MTPPNVKNRFIIFFLKLPRPPTHLFGLCLQIDLFFICSVPLTAWCGTHLVSLDPQLLNLWLISFSACSIYKVLQGRLHNKRLTLRSREGKNSLLTTLWNTWNNASKALNPNQFTWSLFCLGNLISFSRGWNNHPKNLGKFDFYFFFMKINI